MKKFKSNTFKKGDSIRGLPFDLEKYELIGFPINDLDNVIDSFSDIIETIK